MACRELIEMAELNRRAIYTEATMSFGDVWRKVDFYRVGFEDTTLAFLSSPPVTAAAHAADDEGVSSSCRRRQASFIWR